MVKVTVIGGGNLGIKIAGELAYHGHEVRIYDRSPEALDHIRMRIQEDKRLLIEDGLLVSPSFLGAIYYISRLEEAVKSSDLIFEALPEELALKQDLFEWIAQCCKQDAIIASNSLNFTIDQIAERAVYKERCLGVRFLFPVYCIPEVEIAVGKLTSVSTLQTVQDFLSRMGKVAFFRSGEDPLILSPEQRETKKIRFIKHLQNYQDNAQKKKRCIPNLADKQVMTRSVDLDAEYSSREKDCVVCMDEERNCVLHPCHHMCTCTTCGRLLLKRQDACPICRKHISSIFRVFHS